MDERRQFADFQEFYRFYLTQHAEKGNRALHAIGTSLGISIGAWALATGRPWRMLWGLPVAYGFAWCGHFLLEKNAPATFGHPWWSLMSDYRMIWDMLRRRIK